MILPFPTFRSVITESDQSKRKNLFIAGQKLQLCDVRAGIGLFTALVLRRQRDIGKIVFEGNDKRLVPLAHVRHTLYVRRALFHTIALIAVSPYEVFVLKKGSK